jgi:hypothetical protein
MGGGSGGCRQRAEAAAEVRRGGELGKRKSSANVGVGMQEWVRGKLQDVLGVQKKAWPCGSMCWHARGMRGSSGSGGATWSGREGSSAGWGAAARVLGRHVAPRRAARGWPVLGTWPVKAAGSSREENRGGGLEVDEGGLSCKFPKVQGLQYKA